MQRIDLLKKTHFDPILKTIRKKLTIDRVINHLETIFVLIIRRDFYSFILWELVKLVLHWVGQ